jgi:pimeloyl-ACP methyl ester carboxylesterase
VPEPSHRQLSQEHPHAFAIGIHDVRTGPSHADGALHAHVAGVVALAPQTYGATLAGRLAPRPLLVVHGKTDTRPPYSCGVQMYHWAQEPKQLVLYEGAEHRLDECADALDQLLLQWIPATLRSTA